MCAIYNEVLEGGLNRSLVGRLAMVGGSPAPALAPEIFPTLDLGVRWEELAFPQGWRRWQGTMTQAAVAGEATRFLFQNPAASGVLVVLEEIWFNLGDTIAVTAGTTVRGDWGYGNIAALATANALAEPRDTRMATSGGGALLASRGTAVGLLTGLAVQQTIFGGPDQPVIGGPWLLYPTFAGGGSMLFGTGVANLAVTCNYVWSERAMTRGELG